MRRKLISIGVILIIALAITAWFTHKPLRARYYVRQLGAATENAHVNYDGLVAVSDRALPRIVELMRRDAVNIDFLYEALKRIVQSMPKGDPRLSSTGELLANAYPECGVRSRFITLRLTEELAARGELESATRIIRAALKDSETSLRSGAIESAMKFDRAPSEALVPMLRDAEASVRRRALEMLANSRDLAADEDFLPLLHDPDAALRERCGVILRERGLSDKDLQLGRLLSDPSPLMRLKVIDRLPADADLDPQVWLQRLTQDPSPAVRVGAVRAAMDPTSPLGVNLKDRVRQMAQSDPDGTVRQIADYLLRTQTN